jgi:two-component system, OmpR family, sensor histidine kinase SenX3
MGAAAGLSLGAGAVLATRLPGPRWRGRAQSGPAPEPELPPGIADVLAVLRSSAVVVADDDSVVKASPAAYAYGIVARSDLTHPELRELARRVRRDGVIRESELELARGPLGPGRLVVRARVAPLTSGLLLLLVEDRTQADRVEQVRRDFVANVSHELKTPVGGMSLLAEAMLDASDDPEAVRRFAARMQVESGRLGRLVQEIIDLSRLQVADTLQPPRRVMVAEVVAEAVDRCRVVAAAKGIAVEVGDDREAAVYGDADLLMTAVRNLVDNAVAYSGNGTKVSVTISRHHGIVEVAVTDEGIGIPEDEQARVFERFYRVDPARSRTTGGTGLGLAIVKHVCANHGGEATVWSRTGEGSTFTMRLPEADDRPGASVRLAAPTTAVHGSSIASTTKVSNLFDATTPEEAHG